MKQFLFLIKTTKARLVSLSPDQMQRHVAGVRAFLESLIASGQIEAAHPVEMAGVALRGFRGAFQETLLDTEAEIVGAYYLVGAENLKDALLLAKADPRFEDAIWTTEIRPILDANGIGEEAPILETPSVTAARLELNKEESMSR